MATMISRKCEGCEQQIKVREADVARGWGRFCSKSCKAKKQTKQTGIAGPNYRAIGRTVQQMRSGSYAPSKFTAPDGHTVKLNKACCVCGGNAVNGIFGTSESGEWSAKHRAYIEWYCERHHDDTHPFSEDAFS